MLKLTDNPPIKPPGVAKIRELAGEWWVAHTRARHEKAFAFELMRLGIGHFLPMAERVTFSGGRKRRNMAALFPGYVFFNGSVDDRYRALATNRVANIIPATDQVLLRRQLDGLEAALDAEVALDAHPELAVGRQVIVKRGPLQGTVGHVADRGDVTLLVIEVTVLGQRAALHVEPSFLEPFDG